MCPVLPASNQDGRQAKNRKMWGDDILIVHCCFSIGQNELKFTTTYDGRRTKPDGKSSRGLWPDELKRFMELMPKKAVHKLA
jgi:hypothetical protein